MTSLPLVVLARSYYINSAELRKREANEIGTHKPVSVSSSRYAPSPRCMLLVCLGMVILIQAGDSCDGTHSALECIFLSSSADEFFLL